MHKSFEVKTSDAPKLTHYVPPSMKSAGEYACLRLLLSARCSGPFRTCRAVSTAPVNSSLRSLLTGLSSGCLVSPVSSWYTLNGTAGEERETFLQ